MPEINSQETNSQATQQETNSQFPQSSQEQQAEQQPQVEQQVEQQAKVEQQVQSSRKNNSDRIAELESKIAKMEAIYQLQGQNVVDMEVCTDLLLKGYTIEQLKQSKPYLFGQSGVASQGVVRQPPKVVAETQTPKSQAPSGVSSEGFVKTLANMLISKF